MWYRIPSANKILSMSLWQRFREKLLAKAAFAYALRASVCGYVMTITSPSERNRWLTALSRLDSSLRTRQSGARSNTDKSK